MISILGKGVIQESFFPMYDIPILNNRVMCRALSDLCGDGVQASGG